MSWAALWGLGAPQELSGGLRRVGLLGLLWDPHGAGGDGGLRSQRASRGAGQAAVSAALREQRLKES